MTILTDADRELIHSTVINEDEKPSGTYTFTNKEGAVVAGCMVAVAALLLGKDDAAAEMVTSLATPEGIKIMIELSDKIKDTQMPAKLLAVANAIKASRRATDPGLN